MVEQMLLKNSERKFQTRFVAFHLQNLLGAHLDQ